MRGKVPNEHARALRKRSTDTERKLWHYLRDRQIEGCKFRRQHPIAPYIVDFICIEKRLIVEADGSQHAEQATYDERRTAFLESQGLRVLRFWDNEILNNMNGVLETIRLSLLETPSPVPNPAHPLPLPSGERAGVRGRAEKS